MKDENQFEEEDFFDADQVFNSIDLQASAKRKTPNAALTAKNPSSSFSSRLSLPTNGAQTAYKPSTSKRLFSLISGHSKNHQQQQQEKEKAIAFQNNQQRRLSDFHRPTKVSFM